MDVVYSVNGVPIRLSAERWLHIVENHDEVAGHYENVLLTIEEPDYIQRGYRSSLIAVRNFGRERFLNVIYKELSQDDGFIITAFFKSQSDRKNAFWTN